MAKGAEFSSREVLLGRPLVQEYARRSQGSEEIFKIVAQLFPKDELAQSGEAGNKATWHIGRLVATSYLAGIHRDMDASAAAAEAQSGLIELMSKLKNEYTPAQFASIKGSMVEWLRSEQPASAQRAALLNRLNEF
jgi:hypothetical protein